MAISLMGNGYIKDAYQMFSNNLKKMPTDWNIGYAYYARCCYELGLMEEYYKVLSVAIKKNLAETKELLADLYPKNCKPVNYNQFTPMQRTRKTDENTLPI